MFQQKKMYNVYLLQNLKVQLEITLILSEQKSELPFFTYVWIKKKKKEMKKSQALFAFTRPREVYHL